MTWTVYLAAGSLLVIGIGCYFVYPPLGLIVPGALVWVDMTIEGWQRRRQA